MNKLIHVLEFINALEINDDIKFFFFQMFDNFSDVNDTEKDQTFLKYKKELLQSEDLFFETISIFSFYYEDEKKEYLKFYRYLQTYFNKN